MFKASHQLGYEGVIERVRRIVGAVVIGVPEIRSVGDHQGRNPLVPERRLSSVTPCAIVFGNLEEPPTHATRHQGSRGFVKRLTEAGGRVAGAIILEMVGLTTPKQRYPLFLQWAGYPDAGNFIGVVGNRASKPLGERVLRGMRKNPALPVESLFVWFNGWILADTRLSDHAPFWDQGIPALMITDTAYFRNPNYHGPNDTADTLDYAFMAELVRSLEHAFDAL